MMEPTDTLHIPKMFVVLKGWADAGGMAQAVFDRIREKVPCRTIAHLEMDVSVHGLEHRPQILVHHGVLKDFQWPALEFHRPEDPAYQDVVFAVGWEPAAQWRRFLADFVSLLESWRCRHLLLLGSLYDQIFYDEIRLSGVAVDAAGYNWLRRWGCQLAEYAGPAAIHSAILNEVRAKPITAVNLWAHVPFYLKDAQELLVHRVMEIVGDFAGIPWNLDDLLEGWKNREREIEQILSQDPSLREQIRALKKHEAYPAPKDSKPARGEVIDLRRFQKKAKDENDPA
jgi:hypothetical protein